MKKIFVSIFVSLFMISSTFGNLDINGNNSYPQLDKKIEILFDKIDEKNIDNQLEIYKKLLSKIIKVKFKYKGYKNLGSINYLYSKVNKKYLEEKEFINSSHELFLLLSEKKYELLSEKFINPDIGLKVLHNYGTIVNTHKYISFQDFIDNFEKSIIESKFGGGEYLCKLEKGRIPDYCDDDFCEYSEFLSSGACDKGSCEQMEGITLEYCEKIAKKDLCIMENNNNYRNLYDSAVSTAYMQNIIDDKEIQKLESVKLAKIIDATIKREIYFDYMRFGFSYNNGKWQLTVIDLSDCSS